jgi:hypothetical protein
VGRWFDESRVAGSESSFAEWAAKACVAKYSKEFVNLASVRTEPLDPPTRDLGTFMGFERSRGGLEIVLWGASALTCGSWNKSRMEYWRGCFVKTLRMTLTSYIVAYAPKGGGFRPPHPEAAHLRPAIPKWRGFLLHRGFVITRGGRDWPGASGARPPLSSRVRLRGDRVHQDDGISAIWVAPRGLQYGIKRYWRQR